MSGFARASLTTADGLVGITIDAEALARDLEAKPKQVATAANRVSWDLHDPRRGFIARRFIKRAPALISGEGRFSGARRFVARELRTAGGAKHRRPGRVELDGIVGETFSVSERLGAHVEGKRPTGAAQFVPAPGYAGTRKWRRLVRKITELGAEAAGYVFVKRSGRVYIIRARKRRYRGRKFEVVGFVRRNVGLPGRIDVDGMFADLPGKMADNFVREMGRVFREERAGGRR